MCFRLYLFSFFLFFVKVLAAQEITIVTEEENICVDLDEHLTLAELGAQIEFSTGKSLTSNRLILECGSDVKAYLIKNSDLKAHGEFLGHPRRYDADVTPQEKGDIRFIVTTLATKSLISIAKQRSNLEQAGDRIDHIHPFKFLVTVFLDEELKVGIRNIRSRGWIWNDFVHGISKCFATELKHQNLKEADRAHFAKTLEIDLNAINSFIENQQWVDLIDTLIALVPRKGDHGRYDS